MSKEAVQQQERRLRVETELKLRAENQAAYKKREDRWLHRTLIMPASSFGIGLVSAGIISVILWGAGVIGVVFPPAIPMVAAAFIAVAVFTSLVSVITYVIWRSREYKHDVPILSEAEINKKVEEAVAAVRCAPPAPTTFFNPGENKSPQASQHSHSSHASMPKTESGRFSPRDDDHRSESSEPSTQAASRTASPELLPLKKGGGG